MANAQEWLDENYPKEGVCVRENETHFINDFGKTRQEITVLRIREQNIAGSLDLAGFANLEILDCAGNQLTNLNVSKNINLKELNCPYNQFTSVEFLNDLSHPEKLEKLTIYNNNIQPTDIAIFSKLVNIKVLKIGTMKSSLTEGKHNKFSGSLSAYQNLTKLESVCIEATAVDSGLEYLSASLAQATKGGKKYCNIECSSHDTDAKCKTIQDQLRPFDYDLGAWQLANFDLMLRVNPSNLWKLNPTLFTEKEKIDKLINSLIAKIEETQQELGLSQAKEAKNTKKIARLESKLSLLQEKVAELEEQNTSLEEENTQLQEELQMEREEAEESAEAMDNFYRQNPPREDMSLQNILQEVSADYLTTNRENKQLKEEKNRLENCLKMVKEFAVNDQFKLKSRVETAEEIIKEREKDIQELQASKQNFKIYLFCSFSLLGLIGLIFLLSKWIKRNQNHLGK
jgi:hypothetical protein